MVIRWVVLEDAHRRTEEKGVHGEIFVKYTLLNKILSWKSYPEFRIQHICPHIQIYKDGYGSKSNMVTP